MLIEIEGSIPKRCLFCGGLMIANTKHECLTGVWSSSVKTETHKITEPKSYVDGMVELAEKLGLEESREGILVRSEDGKGYSLVDIINKHIEFIINNTK